MLEETSGCQHWTSFTTFGTFISSTVAVSVSSLLIQSSGLPYRDIYQLIIFESSPSSSSNPDGRTQWDYLDLLFVAVIAVFNGLFSVVFARLALCVWKARNAASNPLRNFPLFLWRLVHLKLLPAAYHQKKTASRSGGETETAATEIDPRHTSSTLPSHKHTSTGTTNTTTGSIFTGANSTATSKIKSTTASPTTTNPDSVVVEKRAQNERENLAKCGKVFEVFASTLFIMLIMGLIPLMSGGCPSIQTHDNKRHWAAYTCEDIGPHGIHHPSCFNPVATLFLNGEEGAVKHLFARDTWAQVTKPSSANSTSGHHRRRLRMLRTGNTVYDPSPDYAEDDNAEEGKEEGHSATRRAVAASGGGGGGEADLRFQRKQGSHHPSEPFSYISIPFLFVALGFYSLLALLIPGLSMPFGMFIPNLFMGATVGRIGGELIHLVFEQHVYPR
jgi:hypothetical protein